MSLYKIYRFIIQPHLSIACINYYVHVCGIVYGISNIVNSNETNIVVESSYSEETAYLDIIHCLPINILGADNFRKCCVIARLHNAVFA